MRNTAAGLRSPSTRITSKPCRCSANYAPTWVNFRKHGNCFSGRSQSTRILSLRSLPSHRKMTSDDAAWLKGAETLLAKRPTLADEISLRFALGKYFDDVGRYDEAFDHYHGANEMDNSYGP